MKQLFKRVHFDIVFSISNLDARNEWYKKAMNVGNSKNHRQKSTYNEKIISLIITKISDTFFLKICQ